MPVNRLGAGFWAPPTRYPYGVATQPIVDPMGFYGAPDPTRYYTWYEDFDYLDPNNWVNTKTGTGTLALSTSLENGALVATNSAANGDAEFLQWTGNTGAPGSVMTPFKLTAGKQLWFKAKFQVDDATNAAFYCGIQAVNVTPLIPVNGVIFRKSAASTTLNLISTAASVNTIGATAVMANATYVEVGFYYDGGVGAFNGQPGAIIGYLNGVAVVSIVPAALPTVAMAIGFGIQNGTAAARSATLDYMMCSKER